MPSADQLAPALILFGLALGLLLALGALAARGHHPARLLLVGLFACFAFSLLPSLFHSLGRVVSPAALNLGRVAHFVLGPLVWLYLSSLSGRRLRRFDLLHFAPATGSALLVWTLLPAGPFPGPDEDHLRWLRENPLGWLAGVHLLSYLLAALRRAYLWRAAPGEARYGMLAVLSLYIVGMLLGVIGMVSDADHRLAHIAVAGLVPVLALHFLLVMRQPILLGETGGREREVRGSGKQAAVARLSPDETRRMRARLRRLMEDERLFMDEDLSLSRLAGLLGLSNHQLSWLLNEEQGESFYALVNRYRIEAAREMLRTQPERTVLQIAMAVGFNSKSSFHAAFTRLTGRTPAAYRKEVSRSQNPSGP